MVPVQLRRGLFTIGALDNLDHNPSNTTAKGSFHGTGITIFQFPTSSNFGEQQDSIRLNVVSNNYKLPDSFTTVPAVAVNAATVSVPQVSTSMQREEQLDRARLTEKRWIQHASQLLEKHLVENETPFPGQHFMLLCNICQQMLTQL